MAQNQRTLDPANRLLTQEERADLNADRGLEGGPVRVSSEAGGEAWEGVIIRGYLEPETGAWDLDNEFFIRADDGDVAKVRGWTVETAIVTDAGADRR